MAAPLWFITRPDAEAMAPVDYRIEEYDGRGVFD